MISSLNDISEDIVMFGFSSLRSMTKEESLDFEKDYCYTKNETHGLVYTDGNNRLCFLDEGIHDWFVSQAKLVYPDLELEEVFFVRGSGHWVKCLDILINF